MGGINAQEILNNIPKINPLNVFALFCPPLPQQQESEQRGRRPVNSKIPAGVEEDTEDTENEEEDEKIPPTIAHVDSEVVIFETDDEADVEDEGHDDDDDDMPTPYDAATSTPQKEDTVPFVIPQT